jgi:hypothetical protein
VAGIEARRIGCHISPSAAGILTSADAVSTIAIYANNVKRMPSKCEWHNGLKKINRRFIIQAPNLADS